MISLLSTSVCLLEQFEKLCVFGVLASGGADSSLLAPFCLPMSCVTTEQSILPWFFWTYATLHRTCAPSLPGFEYDSREWVIHVAAENCKVPWLADISTTALQKAKWKLCRSGFSGHTLEFHRVRWLYTRSISHISRCWITFNVLSFCVRHACDVINQPSDSIATIL